MLNTTVKTNVEQKLLEGTKAKQTALKRMAVEFCCEIHDAKRITVWTSDRKN